MRRFAVRMKINRTVIPFDDRDRAAFLQVSFQRIERLDGTGEMLQDETDKNMVEGFRLIGQSEDIRLCEPDIRPARCICHTPGFL
ncbi:MAG: hypothetical protein A4E72_00335 [Syntrophus sp. PtaU1.Bin208]|nr:MAG: hypothetical protein A4E72_00335 [Syntrophus sp. PtaU1.Bin208]